MHMLIIGGLFSFIHTNFVRTNTAANEACCFEFTEVEGAFVCSHGKRLKGPTLLFTSLIGVPLGKAGARTPNTRTHIYLIHLISHVYFQLIAFHSLIILFVIRLL